MADVGTSEKLRYGLEQHYRLAARMDHFAIFETCCDCHTASLGGIGEDYDHGGGQIDRAANSLV
jgi:hypothetical protein